MRRSSLGGREGVYAAITARIVAAIEAGAGAFVMPWHGRQVGPGRPTNAATGKRYQGGNVVALWAEAQLSGFSSEYWATYRQWQGLGAQVRKGEGGACIVFWKPVEGASEEDDEEPRRRWLARASYVFNADQVEGWQAPEIVRPGLAEIIPTVEAFVTRTGADIRHGFDHACYRLNLDRIELPDPDRFTGSPTSTPTESYYATKLHELVHWTGAAHRLNRTFGRMGSEEYAFEELVAELGAAFLCADLCISNDPRPDHAGYLGHWLAALKGDAGVLLRAANLASRAARLLHD